MWKPSRGHEDATLYGSVILKSCGQGLGLLLFVDFRQIMYILPASKN